MTVLITGGAGFIGSNFIHEWFCKNNEKLINLDLLTYSANLSNLKEFKNDSRYVFINGNINDKSLVSNIFAKYQPRLVINFAAESHVDRSINNPSIFIETNVLGTLNLLECALNFYNNKEYVRKDDFIFLHISTDEVFGEINLNDPPFDEDSKYFPNSPYSASKASSDHLVRSFNVTYNLPTIITNCSNNFGPYQSVDKFIPLVINRAIKQKNIPIYGNGLNVRDWLYVSDHCSALIEIIINGKTGQTYNIGAQNERNNNEVVFTICDLLDELIPISGKDKKSYKELIKYVKDRPGHDKRYAVNSNKLRYETNWAPEIDFSNGIRKTIEWYLNNQKWVKDSEKKL